MTPADLPPSLASRIQVAESGCWHWTGSVREGYGQLSVRTDGQVRTKLAHRLVYGLLVDEIADGMTLDHLCHSGDASCSGGSGCVHRRCVNPAHLEPMSIRDNLHASPNTIASIAAAKTECKHGHPFTPENTLLRTRPNGTVNRNCRECGRLTAARRRQAVQPDARLDQRPRRLPAREAAHPPDRCTPRRHHAADRLQPPAPAEREVGPMSTIYDPDVTVEAALIENAEHECPVLRVQDDGERMTCLRRATWAALFTSKCCDRDAWVYLCDDCAGLTHLWCAVHSTERIPRAAFIALI